MTHDALSEDVAEILEGLGKYGQAETIRWGQPSMPELADQIWEYQVTAEELESAIEDLESLLCKRCSEKWSNEKGES